MLHSDRPRDELQLQKDSGTRSKGWRWGLCKARLAERERGATAEPRWVLPALCSAPALGFACALSNTDSHLPVRFLALQSSSRENIFGTKALKLQCERLSSQIWLSQKCLHNDRPLQLISWHPTRLLCPHQLLATPLTSTSLFGILTAMICLFPSAWPEMALPTWNHPSDLLKMFCVSSIQRKKTHNPPEKSNNLTDNQPGKR